MSRWRRRPALDLTPRVGIPLRLTRQADDPLVIGPGGFVERHVRRSLEEMRPFLADPDAHGLRYVYHAYRGAMLREDYAWFVEQGLQHQITVVLPGTLSREWYKTAGHYHSYHRRGRRYPEVAEVLCGHGLIVLQQLYNPERIAEIVAVAISAGDMVVIPPGYGHVLINAGGEELVVSHVYGRETVLEYEEMARHRGAGYWFGPDGEWANPGYVAVPPLVRVRADQLDMPFVGDRSLYRTVRDHPDWFRFLCEPQLLR